MAANQYFVLKYLFLIQNYHLLQTYFQKTVVDYEIRLYFLIVL